MRPSSNSLKLSNFPHGNEFQKRQYLDSYMGFSISYITSQRPNTNRNVAYILAVIKEKKESKKWMQNRSPIFMHYHLSSKYPSVS